MAVAKLRTAIQAAKSRSFIQRPASSSKRFCNCAAPKVSTVLCQAVGVRPWVPATGRGYQVL